MKKIIKQPIEAAITEKRLFSFIDTISMEKSNPNIAPKKIVLSPVTKGRKAIVFSPFILLT